MLRRLALPLLLAPWIWPGARANNAAGRLAGAGVGGSVALPMLAAAHPPVAPRLKSASEELAVDLARIVAHHARTWRRPDVPLIASGNHFDGDHAVLARATLAGARRRG